MTLTISCGESHTRPAVSSWGPEPDSIAESISEVQATLGEVNPLSAEEWEHAIRASERPVEEMAFWLQVARTYQRRVTVNRGLSFTQRKACLHQLLTKG